MMIEYLEATRWINHADPRVRRKAAELVALGRTPQEKIQAIGKFVREWVRLEVEKGSRLATASEVLCFGRGTATGKAVLFAALCRAEGLPCRIRLQRLSGAPDRWTALGMLAKMEWEEAHPMNEVSVGGRWIAVDVSLDSQTACQIGMQMPFITGDSDATLGEAFCWVEDSMLSLGDATIKREDIPAELLRLVHIV